MTNTGAKASLRKVVLPQEPASTTEIWHCHQTHCEQVTLLRGSLVLLSQKKRLIQKVAGEVLSESVTG